MARARLTPALAATLLAVPALAPLPASAGEAPCWLDGGVLVAPAEVAGVAGDYVLDTGQPVTQLHETKAQAEGLATAEMESPAVTGAIRLAGLDLPPRSIPVVDLDYRGWRLPTPIAGVIGADVLKDFVLDITFAPCRVRLSHPGEAPPLRARETLALSWDAGRPVVEARVSDGRRRLTGLFTPATGEPAAVRLADDLASVAGTDRPQELQPTGVWLARLPELRLGRRRLSDQAAGLEPAHGQGAGVIGGPVLSRYRLRFDFPGGKLLLSPVQ